MVGLIAPFARSIRRGPRLTTLSALALASALVVGGCVSDYDRDAPDYRQPLPPPERASGPVVDPGYDGPYGGSGTYGGSYGGTYGGPSPAGYDGGPAGRGYDDVAGDELGYVPPPREVMTTYETDLSPYGSWVDEP